MTSYVAVSGRVAGSLSSLRTYTGALRALLSGFSTHPRCESLYQYALVPLGPGGRVRVFGVAGVR